MTSEFMGMNIVVQDGERLRPSLLSTRIHQYLRQSADPRIEGCYNGPSECRGSPRSLPCAPERSTRRIYMLVSNANKSIRSCVSRVRVVNNGTPTAGLQEDASNARHIVNPWIPVHANVTPVPGQINNEVCLLAGFKPGLVNCYKDVAFDHPGPASGRTYTRLVAIQQKRTCFVTCVQRNIIAYSHTYYIWNQFYISNF